MNLKAGKRELALALVLATAGLGFADNRTPATARNIAVNSTSQDFLDSGARASVWYRVQLFAGRSYQISVWTIREDGVFVNVDPLELYSDPAGTTLVTVGVTTTDGVFEGSPNDATLGPRTTIFQAGATGLYLIHAGTNTAGLSATRVHVRVRETTLFSPWTSKAAGFEGFMEIHNNTNGALSVTLSAYNNLGVLQGSGLTFSMPANATVFKTATDIGVPADTFAGVVLTHNGAFGAVSGNITTLNGANGLSFDSPFTAREAGGGSDIAERSGGSGSGLARFSGVQVNTPISALTGWTMCYSDTFANGSTSLATILAACSKANLLLACRVTGSPTLATFAHAPRADVIFDTGTGANSTHSANDVAWYYNGSWSWGYLPSGQTANRNSCDVGATGATDRLCFHTGSGLINAGWRCGSATGLFSGSYERLIFHAN
jgi:hypothetical protein